MTHHKSLKSSLAIAILALGTACATVGSQEAAPVVEENLALKAALSQQDETNKERFLRYSTWYDSC